MSNERRKNVEAIALRFAEREGGAGPAEKEVVALQGSITASPWEWGVVQREIQAVFADELVPSTWQWPIGTAGVIDEPSESRLAALTPRAVFPAKSDTTPLVGREPMRFLSTAGTQHEYMRATL